MTLLATPTTIVAPAQDVPRRPTCWGMTARDLHDRRWALRAVQVVRRGEGATPARGPELYLLLEPDDLTLFDPAPVVKRLAWLKPRVMRLRVSDADAEAMRERVSQDEEGRLLDIRRQYRPRVRATMRAMLTPEPGLAALWASAPGSRAEALAALWAEVGREQRAIAECAGRVFSGEAADAEMAVLGRMVRSWRNVGAVVEGVYEFQAGVWAHESSRIEPGARLVAPLWIGRGAHVPNGRTVVGPGMVPDRAAEPAPAFDWGDLRAPAWRLGPRLRGRPGWAIIKRLFDIGFATCALLGTLPLYPVIIGLIVAEDGWPAFFAHRRQTRGGREFPCYKFRTMCKNAEAMKAKLAASNQADGPQFFIDDDPRLLRVGRVLRRFQLDELPQFWNVLLGHMSVVGPRPSPDKENQYCPAWREARLSVRPGVTGLWQVARTRAPATDFQEWIRYDLEYVQKQSWRLDLWIIWRTIRRVLGG